MFKSKKQQSFSIEKIADSFLAELAKCSPEDKPPFLDAFLKEQNIYVDIEKLQGAIRLLLSNELVEKERAGGFSIFTYVPGTSLESISGLVSAVPQLRITNKGAHFIKGGQMLDEKGKAAQTEATKKRNDRWISAAISFGVAVGVMVIKWFFFDNK